MKQILSKITSLFSKRRISNGPPYQLTAEQMARGVEAFKLLGCCGYNTSELKYAQSNKSFYNSEHGKVSKTLYKLWN